MNISKALFLGFARGLGVVVLTAVLSYLGVVDHLAFLPPWMAAIVSAAALAAEAGMEAKTGKALFGAVRTR